MKKSLFSLLAIVAMTSCTQSDILLRSDNNVEILLKSSALSVEAVTRSPFNGQISASNTLEGRVVATATSGNYATHYVDGKMIFADPTTTTHFETGYAGKKYYPVDGTDLYIFGLYPATGWTLSTKGEFTFTGTEDVMVAKEVSWNKSKAQQTTGNIPNLDFIHLLTKLNISLQAADDDAIEAWGTISKIELLKVKSADPNTQASVDLVRGMAAANTFNGGASPFKCYGMTETASVKTYTDVEYASQNYTLTKVPVYQAYSLIAPVELADPAVTGDLQFKIYAAGANNGAQEVTVELKDASGQDFTGFTQGKAFDINLKFMSTNIVATASVTDWTQAGSSDTEIQ